MAYKHSETKSKVEIVYWKKNQIMKHFVQNDLI